MTNPRPLQFAKDCKYSITNGGHFIKVINTSNPSDYQIPAFRSISITPRSDNHFPDKNRPFHSVPIGNRHYCWVDICIRCGRNFDLFEAYFREVTHRSFSNVISSSPWGDGPEGHYNIYYPIILEDNWKDKFNLIFSIIHDFDPFDKQTVKIIYDYINLASPLLDAYYQCKRALARGATMGLFAHLESHNLSTLPSEMAARIGDYLGNEASYVACACKAAASIGKAELERENQILTLKC